MRKFALIVCSSALALAGCREAETPTKPVTVESEVPTLEEMQSEGETGGAGNASLASNPTTPVRVGLDGPDMNACGNYAEVADLTVGDEAFATVRAAPDANATGLDRLPPGLGVSVCSNENGFAGIVYSRESDLGSCGTGSPVPQEQDYDGPCQSGWVDAKQLKMLAG